MLTELHPVDFESVYLNEEYKLKEERTVYLNGVVLSDREVAQEEKHRILMYELFLGAQSLKNAKRMEVERLEYFECLYDFSYGVVNLGDDQVFLGSTESKALEIIDIKAAYNKKIISLKDRYKRFRGLVSTLNEDDTYLLRSYFEHGHKVDYEVLRACINRLYKYLSEQEEARSKALDSEVIKEYAKNKKLRRITESKAASKKNEGKQQYLVDGSFVYMSEKEYQKYRQQEDSVYFGEGGIIGEFCTTY